MNLERFFIIQNHKGWFNYNLWNYKCKLTQDLNPTYIFIIFYPLSLKKSFSWRKICHFYCFKRLLIFALLN